ncbi:MAG: hypothetical protein HGB08_02065 [Candidatus Moranbacteria bacterium]|nr:hypothetical protein [Candidatus Moranbacteria bacterium]
MAEKANGMVVGFYLFKGGKHHFLVSDNVCAKEDIARCLGQTLFEKLGIDDINLANAKVFIEGREVAQRL